MANYSRKPLSSILNDTPLILRYPTASETNDQISAQDLVLIDSSTGEVVAAVSHADMFDTAGFRFERDA